jgi:hypothetical protein
VDRIDDEQTEIEFLRDPKGLAYKQAPLDLQNAGAQYPVNTGRRPLGSIDIFGENVWMTKKRKEEKKRIEDS